MSIIVFVISENILVVYRYPCRLLSLWYQRTYWLYIDTHVDYCLCDIREHTGCIELPMSLLSLWYQRTFWYIPFVSIIVFVISENILVVYRYPCRLLSLWYQRNILVVYRYPCRLLSLWYQRTYWLYIDTHVDYYLCDITEHTGCNRYPCRLLSLWYRRTFWLYIDTHVDYCLCDIREHPGCI